MTSANQIQADTGFTFFTSLAASVATALRAKIDSSSTAPTPAPAISSFSPASGPVGSSVVFTGSGLTSASAVKFNGASAATFTVNSDTQLTATVPTGATTGTIAITTPGGTAVSSGTFTITAGGGLVISQVYGGGGNSGATYTNDFIELYNTGSASVDLSNYAVQYASATGSSWSVTNLSGTVAADHYYLVQEAAGGTTVKALPTPEATGTMNLSSASGKVALTNTQTLLTTSNPVGTAAVVDFVGYGTANAYEGSGAAPTLTSSTAAQRGGGGTTDTNNNSADFTAVTPVPHN